MWYTKFLVWIFVQAVLSDMINVKMRILIKMAKIISMLCKMDFKVQLYNAFLEDTTQLSKWRPFKKLPTQCGCCQLDNWKIGIEHQNIGDVSAFVLGLARK